MRSGFQLKLLAGITISVLGMQAQASGFRVPEISTTGMGLSNALVANKDEVGAMAYNPAIMAFQESNTFQIGATMIGYDLSVTPTGGNPTSSTAKDTFVIPNTFLSTRTSENITFGLAINAPFGLETRWPKDTFPKFTGSAAKDGAEPEHSKISMVNVNPSIAIKMDSKTSVALGIMFYDVSSLVFNSQTTDINGSGSGFGWNLAMLHTTKNWDFGLSYKSNVTTNLSGNLGSSSASASFPASSSIEFPDMMQLGLLYRFTDRFNMEFDIERTGWQSFDKIRIEYKTTTGQKTTTSTTKWDNVLAYRLGATYEISDKTRLRFGYSLDDTPQSEAWFSARTPGNDRQLFSIGVGHDFGGWTLDASYMRVEVDTRTINSSVAFGVDRAEANGTDAYNGTYESDINLLGLGISTTF